MFDCHAHVFKTLRVIGAPRYAPKAPAPLKAWADQLEANGLKGGVIVQPSFLGSDNGDLLEALSNADRRSFRGVAVVAMNSSLGELQSLRTRNVRAVRWNLVKGATLPDLASEEVRTFLRRIADAGLHLEVQLEASGLLRVLPLLIDRVDRLVIDHFGLPDGGPDDALARAIGCNRDKVWVKLSAPYRSEAQHDQIGYAQRLLDVIDADHFVWGSDWPWTRHEGRHDYARTVEWASMLSYAGADFEAGARALYDLAS